MLRAFLVSCRYVLCKPVLQDYVDACCNFVDMVFMLQIWKIVDGGIIVCKFMLQIAKL